MECNLFSNNIQYIFYYCFGQLYDQPLPTLCIDDIVNLTITKNNRDIELSMVGLINSYVFFRVKDKFQCFSGLRFGLKDHKRTSPAPNSTLERAYRVFNKLTKVNKYHFPPVKNVHQVK